MNEDFLHKKLEERLRSGNYRKLDSFRPPIDFCSSDYLGIVHDNLLKSSTGVSADEFGRTGSTGSRLLSGNSQYTEAIEIQIANFHDAPAALLFNSGYDANLGLLSAVGQAGDTILYDELAHASIRDGIRLSKATGQSFRHNHLADLWEKLVQIKGRVFVVTESVFSMNGDIPDLIGMCRLCEKYNALLVVDEAHATGVIGEKGEGLVQSLGMQRRCFGRIHTFGKALGVHGAVVLGSDTLRNYLINFSRAFIFSTALPGDTVNLIGKAYGLLPSLNKQRTQLKSLIKLYLNLTEGLPRLESNTAIQGMILPGNQVVTSLAEKLQAQGFDIRPIRYPSVPKGAERLRIMLHAYNTGNELASLIDCIKKEI